MASALRVVRSLWQIPLGTVNAYLLESTDGLVLIDAGWPDKTEAIFRAVRETGHDPQQIRHLVLTHGHIDHAGSAAQIVAQTGARTYAHAADLDLISKGQAEHPGTSVTPGIIPHLVYRFFIKPGGTSYQPFNVDELLEHGKSLPMATDVEVIHSPGHCAGHSALLLRNEGVLIAGDICSNVMGLGYSVVNEDRTLARESILRVAEYPFEQAVFGHGKPLSTQANRRLKEHFANTRVP